MPAAARRCEEEAAAARRVSAAARPGCRRGAPARPRTTPAAGHWPCVRWSSLRSSCPASSPATWYDEPWRHRRRYTALPVVRWRHPPDIRYWKVTGWPVRPTPGNHSHHACISRRTCVSRFPQFSSPLVNFTSVLHHMLRSQYIYTRWTADVSRMEPRK